MAIEHKQYTKKAVEVFISCAIGTEDDVLIEQFVEQLSSAEQENIISVWHRGKIAAGGELKERDLHLEKAQIVIFLVSRKFLKSSDCYLEVERAMDRRIRGNIHVIPVILRSCDWGAARFAGLQVLPKNKNAVASSNHKKEQVLSEIAKSIREIAGELQNKNSADIFPKEILDFSILYGSISRLNYDDQISIFQDFKETSHRIGAFFIYGDNASQGQGWLLDRLIKPLPRIVNAKDKVFDFGRKANGGTFLDLWRDLAEWTDVKYLPDAQYISLSKELELLEKKKQEIIRRIYTFWKGQSVILLLKQLHEVDDENYLNKFIEDFWQPLVKMVIDTYTEYAEEEKETAHYLLMFLIGSSSSIDKWKVPWVKKLDESWEPHVPILFEKLDPFTEGELNEWITLERKFAFIPNSLSVQDILINSENGIPELVLDHIFGKYGHDWHPNIKYRV